MTQETIKCPKCGELIKLSEAISHDKVNGDGSINKYSGDTVLN